jgi:hypothetical protein
MCATALLIPTARRRTTRRPREIELAAIETQTGTLHQPTSVFLSLCIAAKRAQTTPRRIPQLCAGQLAPLKVDGVNL